MIRRRGERSIDADTLFEHERSIVEMSSSLRARMLGRAEGALRTREYVVPKARAFPRPAPFPWTAAAGLVCLAIGAGGAAAYELVVRAHQPLLPVAPAAETSPTPETPAEEGAASPPIARPSTPARRRLLPSPARGEAGREELRLLEPARAAVERGDFALAMFPIAEHARRFKLGRLAEEREALRVRALVGLGRYGEARRAAAAFALHFPRSPLLPAVSEMSASGG
ncbi:MAG TPA: hypothetical protein VGP64_03305 [Polyangia bacterium]|jgi:hypothetical protein